MAIGDLVANLAVAGRPTAVFTLVSNPGGFFVISGSTLREAIDAPDGSYLITIQASVSSTVIATQPFILIFHGSTITIRVTNTGDTRITNTGDTRIISP